MREIKFRIFTKNCGMMYWDLKKLTCDWASNNTDVMQYTGIKDVNTGLLWSTSSRKL